MKKVPVEVLTRAGEQVTIIIPDNLSPLEILGLANEALSKLGLYQARIVVGTEQGGSLTSSDEMVKP